MKSTINIVWSIFLLVSYSYAQSPTAIELEIKSELNNYEGLVFNLEDGLKVFERSGGQKLVITENSENVDLNIFDVNENGAYIKELFITLETINVISKELRIISVFSRDHFINGYEGCGCRKLLFRTIGTYKRSWNLITSEINNINLPKPVKETEETKKMLSFIREVKRLRSNIDNQAINMIIDPQDVTRMEAYILEDVIPFNASSMARLSTRVEGLHEALISYLSYVKLFINKK